jgi:hypothetical protein
MKTAARILNILSSSVLMIIGVAFVFIEGCLIFTGDFLLFESPVRAFLQMILRFALASGVFTLGLFVIIKKERTFIFESILALAVSLLISPFLTNGFGLYFVLLAVVFTLTNLFCHLISKKA